MEYLAFVVVASLVVMSKAVPIDNLEFSEEGEHHLEKRGLVAPVPYPPQEYPPWIVHPGTPLSNEPAVAPPPVDTVYDYININAVQPLDPPAADPEPFIPSRPARRPCSCKGKVCSGPCRLG